MINYVTYCGVCTQDLMTQVDIYMIFVSCRALSEVTDEDLELLRGLAGTPMSYIANKPPIDVAVGQEKYPLGSGLSYQVKQLRKT